MHYTIIRKIKSCDGFTIESDCKSSLLGCQWSSGKCSSATDCIQLSNITCEKSTNSLKDKCVYDSKNGKCNTKRVEIKSCDGFIIESDCKSSLFGCQWSSGKCSSATDCIQLSSITCEKSTNSLKDKCVYDSKNNKCNTKSVEIKSCDGFSIESDCKSSLFGCQWSSGKCSSTTECTQLSQIACENSTNSLKDKCIWDLKSNKCNIKTVEIKSCDGFSIESDCISSLFGCQWSSGKCSSATECTQLSSTTCENSINSLRNLCEWDKENNSCKNRKLCEQFNDSTNCTKSDLGCQWYFEKCIDYFSCNQFGYPLCLNTHGKFKDKCEWYTPTYSKRYCLSKRTSALYCNENINEEDCRRSIIGCYWYKDQCIEADQCNQLSIFTTCLNNTGILKDKCEWATPTYSKRYCRGKESSAEKCSDNLNSDDCTRSMKGCYWYKDQCIEADQCNQLSVFTTCLNNTGILKDKCEWYTPTYSKRYCRGKESSAEKCSDNLNSDDCTRSMKGCKWYRNTCIQAENCNELSYFSVCLNNTHNTLKNKCEWYTPTYSKRYCKDKSEISYIDNCKNITYDECQKGVNGCYWISGKCILPIQCSDFNQTICTNIKSYSSFRGTCEWNEITKKCQRKGDLYGLCRENLDENDCIRSLLGCAWVNNKCVDAHHCSSLSSSACGNLISNAMLRGYCEWNAITNKCQRLGNLYGLCSDNVDENDCSRSLLGCAWVNNECVDTQQCSLLSSSACENLISNAMFRGWCEWNKKTKICEQIGNAYGFCRQILNENDCIRNLLGCAWVNNKCVDAHHCSSLSSSACGNLISNTVLRGYCEWNAITNKCQKLGNLYGLCSDNVDENDCSRSLLGCAWVNNECVMAQKCSSLSSSACGNLISNAMLRGHCEWNKNDKICLEKNRLIRNLFDDEVTTKYKCSFNFPNIDEDKNYDLTLIDKNNNKASISLSLISSYSSIDESDDNNDFVIYRENETFLKQNLLISLILIILSFMFNY